MTTFAIGDLSYVDVEVGGEFVSLHGLTVTADYPSEIILTIDEARRLHEALGFAVLTAQRIVDQEGK